jgi:hypothetical protein
MVAAKTIAPPGHAVSHDEYMPVMGLVVNTCIAHISMSTCTCKHWRYKATPTLTVMLAGAYMYSIHEFHVIENAKGI